MAIEAGKTSAQVIAEIRDDDEYEAAVERITEILYDDSREALEERHALRAVMGRYEQRELIWARVW